MPGQLTTTFYLYANRQEGPVTLGELRTFIDTLDKFNIPESATFEACDLMMDVTKNFDHIHTIECGECSPRQICYDTLIDTHQCLLDR